MIYQATKLCFLLFLGQVVNGVKAVGIIPPVLKTTGNTALSLDKSSGH
jgi:hypothetical protein